MKKKSHRREVDEQLVGQEANILAQVAKVSDKLFSLEQYAFREGKPSKHIPGMRAFVKNPEKKRTLKEWASLFSQY